MVWPCSAFLKDQEAFDCRGLPAVCTVSPPHERPRGDRASAPERDCLLQKPWGERHLRFQMLHAEAHTCHCDEFYFLPTKPWKGRDYRPRSRR